MTDSVNAAIEKAKNLFCSYEEFSNAWAKNKKLEGEIIPIIHVLFNQRMPSEINQVPSEIDGFPLKIKVQSKGFRFQTNSSKDQIKHVNNTICKHAEQYLKRDLNIVAITGGKKVKHGAILEEEAIIFFVEKKIKQILLEKEKLIPQYLDGILTDVQKGSIFDSALIQRRNPLPFGYSISPIDSKGKGTIGCFLKNENDGDIYLLTNDHVIPEEEDKRIVQPGWLDNEQIHFTRNIDTIINFFNNSNYKTTPIENNIDQWNISQMENSLLNITETCGVNEENQHFQYVKES